MLNWSLSVEEFDEEYKNFLSKKYNNFIHEDLEEAFDEWAELLEIGSIVLQALEQRLTELEEARLDEE